MWDSVYVSENELVTFSKRFSIIKKSISLFFHKKISDYSTMWFFFAPACTTHCLPCRLLSGKFLGLIFGTNFLGQILDFNILNFFGVLYFLSLKNLVLQLLKGLILILNVKVIFPGSF